MEYRIAFAAEPPHVTVTTSGIGDPAVFDRFVEEIVEDTRLRPGMTILADHSALDADSMSKRDIESIAAAINRRDAQLGPTRVAKIAPDPVTFGFARMWQAFTADAQLSSRVFYSRDDAVAWLRSESRDAE